MKTNAIWVAALWIGSLGAASTIVGCTKEATNVSAADKAAMDKAAADKEAALRASDKAAMDRAAADKAAAKAASDKAAMDKAAMDKEAADKAAAAKAASDKAAMDKAAAASKAQASALPPDMVESKAELTRAMAQMDLTMAKLEILSTATGDLDKPSEEALAAMTKLDNEIKALKKRGDEMRNKGAAYFESWEKGMAGMTTPEVSDIAMKRKEELAAKYTDVLTAMQESRAALDSYWADMTAIQKVIEDDLTPEKQKLLVPQIAAAKEKAATLKDRVQAAADKLNEVGLIYKKS